MFQNFPKSVAEVLDWDWPRFQAYADDLLARPLTPSTLDSWLGDWSRWGALIGELGSRLYVATTVDTTDKTAEERFTRYLELIAPPLRETTNRLERKLVESGLEPPNFAVPLRAMRQSIELFRQENLPLFTEESKLGMEYDKIIAAQTVMWEGEEKTLPALQPLLQSTDRALRERVWRLRNDRALQDRQALNELWVKLFTLRQRIAHNAGFADYRAYRWKDFNRFDYTPDDTETFHKAIEQVVVPAANRLYDRRRAKLGVDRLRPWDLDVDVHGREPLRPFRTAQELEEKTEGIFRKVDPQLGDFVATMRAEKLLDLDNRKGKAPGGYCTTFELVKRPFIFMNAVGIHDDVQTMLHESGHAFHAFLCSVQPYMHQMGAPIEFCEVASMAMELLAAPYLTRDQGGYYTPAEAARARIEHLEGMIKFWPYMAVVDAFQQWAYTHPDDAVRPEACDAYWTALWERFMVGVDYSGLDDFVATGWQRKLHIFQIPFYYVEYGLAQLGAAQVWAKSLENHAQALSDYKRALALGNTVPLPELFSTAGAKFAFDAPTLGGSIALIESTIASLEALVA